MKNVIILLAAYNGQKYIEEQINSIIEQDYDDWKLILSDDCSTDDTINILDSYSNRFPDKIIHYKSGRRFGNAQMHFMHLLEQFHDAPYIMFCDQDDVWHPDKITKTLSKMKEIEKEASIPAMVHTDLCVVDGNLNIISDSFCKRSKLDGNRLKLNQLLVQNVVTGCTLMMNNSLAELCCRYELPKEAAMHDWWAAIICAVFGKTAFLDISTIYYRQHGNNSVGAKNVTSPTYLWERLKTKSMKKSLRDAVKQAEAFLNCFGDSIPADKKLIITDFVRTKDASIFVKDYIYLKHHIFKCGVIRVLAQFIGG